MIICTAKLLKTKPPIFRRFFVVYAYDDISGLSAGEEHAEEPAQNKEV